jgi:hypothetical protein
VLLQPASRRETHPGAERPTIPSDFTNARQAIAREPLTGRVEILEMPALSYRGESGSFDVTLCIGASFALGTFATAFAGLILIGNLSFPLLIQLHVVDLQCPNTHPTTEPCKA